MGFLFLIAMIIEWVFFTIGEILIGGLLILVMILNWIVGRH